MVVVVVGGTVVVVVVGAVEAVVEVGGTVSVVVGASLVELVVTSAEVVVTALVKSSSSENSHHMKTAMAMSSRTRTDRNSMSRQKGDQPEAACRPFMRRVGSKTCGGRRVPAPFDRWRTFAWASNG